MKLALTLHNKTYSIESDDSFDGTDVYELAEQFKGLLVSAGFHPSNVDDIFNLDYQWFTEKELEENLQGHISENSRAYEYHEQLEKDKKVEDFQNNMYKGRKYE